MKKATVKQAFLTVVILSLAATACVPMNLKSYWHECQRCPKSFVCNRMAGLCEADTTIRTHWGHEGSDVPQ